MGARPPARRQKREALPIAHPYHHRWTVALLLAGGAVLAVVRVIWPAVCACQLGANPSAVLEVGAVACRGCGWTRRCAWYAQVVIFPPLTHAIFWVFAGLSPHSPRPVALPNAAAACAARGIGRDGRVLLFEDATRSFRQLPLTVKGMVQADYSPSLKYLSPAVTTKYMIVDAVNGSVYRNASLSTHVCDRSWCRGECRWMVCDPWAVCGCVSGLARNGDRSSPRKPRR